MTTTPNQCKQTQHNDGNNKLPKAAKLRQWKRYGNNKRVDTAPRAKIATARTTRFQSQDTLSNSTRLSD
jgi:hypothetical protein